MISIYKNKNVMSGENENGLEFRGMSTDTKPTQINGKTIYNGSIFIEIDTGKVYLFDKENQEWKEV